MTDLSKFAHSGPHYTKLLKLVDETLVPARYFEVGTRGGQSLRQFRCDAVCVDPEFVITNNSILTRRKAFFFQMTSDAFFEQYDPKHFLGGPPDISFLDGCHLFEYLLRDIINTERHCRPNSLIILHDCLPPHPFMTRRDDPDGVVIAEAMSDPDLVRIHAPQAVGAKAPEISELDRKPMGWAGDVYRMMFILKRYRPDLRVIYFNAPPTGLVIISNLDPNSNVLADRYFEVVDYASDIQLSTEKMEELFALYPLFDNSKIRSTQISALFPAFN